MGEEGDRFLEPQKHIDGQADWWANDYDYQDPKLWGEFSPHKIVIKKNDTGTVTEQVKFDIKYIPKNDKVMGEDWPLLKNGKPIFKTKKNCVESAKEWYKYQNYYFDSQAGLPSNTYDPKENGEPWDEDEFFELYAKRFDWKGDTEKGLRKWTEDFWSDDMRTESEKTRPDFWTSRRNKRDLDYDYGDDYYGIENQEENDEEADLFGTLPMPEKLMDEVLQGGLSDILNERKFKDSNFPSQDTYGNSINHARFVNGKNEWRQFDPSNEYDIQNQLFDFVRNTQAKLNSLDDVESENRLISKRATEYLWDNIGYIFCKEDLDKLEEEREEEEYEDDLEDEDVSEDIEQFHDGIEIEELLKSEEENPH